MFKNLSLVCLALYSLTACATAQRHPQSAPTAPLQRLKVMNQVSVQNVAAYTVEKPILTTENCKFIALLPPGEIFEMKTGENLLITHYQVGEKDNHQTVHIEFRDFKTRPVKMSCQFAKEDGAIPEYKVADEFEKTFKLIYKGERQTASEAISGDITWRTK